MRNSLVTQFPAKPREPTFLPEISRRVSSRRAIPSPLQRALQHSQKQSTPVRFSLRQCITIKPQVYGSPPLIPIKSPVLPTVGMPPNISRHFHSTPNVRLVSRPTRMPLPRWYPSPSRPTVSSVEASLLSSVGLVIVATAASASVHRAPPLGRRR